jgi:hypothetical protein
MTRRAVILALAGALLGVVGWWFVNNFGFTTERVYVGYSGEARRDPWFAARLLLERMGKQVSTQSLLTSTAGLPQGGTLVLPAYRAGMDPPLVDALFAWVDQGGQLIAGVESPYGRDPLLEALEVEAHWPEDDDERPVQPPQPETIKLPDGRSLRVDLRHEVVLAGGPAAVWRHAGPEGDRIQVFERGRGRIVVLSTLDPFANRALNQLDHAPLLWHLMRDAGPSVVLVRHLESVTLLAWLREHALAVLVALAGLLALWLWRVAPRFGPLQPGAAQPRRSLLEHLQAVGRFHADQQHLARLLRQVRDEAQALFERAAPLSAGLEGPARLREASRLTRLRPRELLQAFTGSISTRNEFSNAVRTLAAFRRRLARSAHRESTR